MTAYSVESSELLMNLGTDPKQGLSSEKVQQGLEKHGENKLKEKPKKTTRKKTTKK